MEAQRLDSANVSVLGLQSVEWSFHSVGMLVNCHPYGHSECLGWYEAPYDVTHPDGKFPDTQPG